MKNILASFTIFLCFFSQSALAQNISAQQFWQIKEAQNPIIIDVRTNAEFEQGKIAGAINIPYQQIDVVTTVITDRELPITLYCRSGRRAGVALQRLEQQGYTNVYNAGGLDTLLNAKP